MKRFWYGAALAGAALLATFARRRHSRELRRVLVPTLNAAAAIALFQRMSHGNTLRYTFVPAMAVSWALYMAVLRKRMPDGPKILPLYLFALAWQFAHFLEEYFTGFQYRWPAEIFNTRPYPDKQYVAINVGSYTIFLLSGIALYKEIPELVMPAIFFVVMGVVGNGIQHPIYCAMVRGYFPGFWTALVNLVIGPKLIRQMLAA